MDYYPYPRRELLGNFNSCLDIVVSCVKNYYSKDPVAVNLLTWLNTDKYKEQVEFIRSTDDKKVRFNLKSNLPAITPSGEFRYVSENHLVRHTGLMQFDIDLKDNRHLTNYTTLHHQLRNISNIAYCGKSVSGQGYWGLVRIGYPERHHEHFEFLRRSLKRMGINIDPAPKNVCSLRGASYDNKAYYNHRAPKLWHYIRNTEHKKQDNVLRHLTAPARIKTLAERLRDACTQIRLKKVDITEGYQQWFGIACDLAATFGEEGREQFHFISCRHHEYTRQDSDKKFDSCLKYVREQQREPSLNYLFKQCRENGIAA